MRQPTGDGNPAARRLALGVTEGTRTPDNQDHNLGLYQLSYGYHAAPRL
jgi:hypothetical protein